MRLKADSRVTRGFAEADATLLVNIRRSVVITTLSYLISSSVIPISCASPLSFFLSLRDSVCTVPSGYSVIGAYRANAANNNAKLPLLTTIED